MTRAIEVAPGCWVVPGEVVSVSNFVSPRDAINELMGRGGAELQGVLIQYRGGGDQQVINATAAEVAAKLWPAEREQDNGDQGCHPVAGFIKSFHGVELHVLREAFHADKSSVNSELWRAVREYLGE